MINPLLIATPINSKSLKVQLTTLSSNTSCFQYFPYNFNLNISDRFSGILQGSGGGKTMADKLMYIVLAR